MTSEISRLEVAVALRRAHWIFRRRIVGIAVPSRVTVTRYFVIVVESRDRGAFLVERQEAEATRDWGRRDIDAAIVADLKTLGLLPRDHPSIIAGPATKELHPCFPDETSRARTERPLYPVSSRKLPDCVRDALVSPGSQLMQRLSAAPNVLAIDTRSVASVRCDHTAAPGLRSAGRLVLEQFLAADEGTRRDPDAGRGTATARRGRGTRAR